MKVAVTALAQALIVALALSNSACRWDGDERSATVSPPPAPTQSDPDAGSEAPNKPTNAAPTIEGAPSDIAVVGEPYSFQAVATDPDTDALSYTVASKPSWASFNTSTGRLWGTPAVAHVGTHEDIVIGVSDGTTTKALPAFNVTVTFPRKANYGHYFAPHYGDTAADAVMLCEQAGVRGIVWRRPWVEIEPRAGVYDFSSYDRVLQAIAGSRNPDCQVWMFVEFKSFHTSPTKNPCPVYLQAQHSALNADGNGAATCFMWEPIVIEAYVAMMQAAAARFDGDPRFEGLIFQESALGLNGAYSQDVADGGTYTAEAWRDGLIELVSQCGAAFRQSRCMAYLNFLRGGQHYLYDVSAAISAVPDNRGCMSGPDLLPDNRTLYSRTSSVYEVLARHEGCRSNSAQNDSYLVPDCGLDCIFQFAVRGTFGDFDELSPRTSGVCVNSYLFWTHRGAKTPGELDWRDALPVIAAYPYGRAWLDQCVGGGGAP
ncbi:MAG TPA: putative Ig domain-containing protein [Steroidobacteraceae bacterium]|nr:putative Ig domain-containing protein [Steroidobacteraceae bacterium]